MTDFIDFTIGDFPMTTCAAITQTQIRPPMTVGGATTVF
jgi:hypothetical protein